MDLTKVLFRPVRYTLEESLRLVVSFDNLHDFVDYILDIYNVVPLLSFYGFDERIDWNCYICLDNITSLPFGYVHVPAPLTYK